MRSGFSFGERQLLSWVATKFGGSLPKLFDAGNRL
jgi:hypothetical protein